MWINIVEECSANIFPLMYCKNWGIGISVMGVILYPRALDRVILVIPVTRVRSVLSTEGNDTESWLAQLWNVDDR